MKSNTKPIIAGGLIVALILAVGALAISGASATTDTANAELTVQDAEGNGIAGVYVKIDGGTDPYGPSNEAGNIHLGQQPGGTHTLLVYNDAGSMSTSVYVNTAPAGKNHFYVTFVPDVVITPTPTPSDEPTVTPVPSDEPTVTPEPSDEPTVTPVPSDEPTVTPVPSDEPTVTPVPSDEPTVTPVPSDEPTVTPVPSNEPTVTPEPTTIPTATPEPSVTPTPEPSVTPTPEPAGTPTPYPMPGVRLAHEHIEVPPQSDESYLFENGIWTWIVRGPLSNPTKTAVDLFNGFMGIR